MLVKLVATELVEGEIDFVSLVKHGANRSPFKIVKSIELDPKDAQKMEVTPVDVRGNVEKDFSSFPGSTDFNENVTASAFFPSLHGAMEALAESTFHSLNKAITLDEAAEQINKNLTAFKKHVNALVKSLPDSVIKMDGDDLAKGLGGSTIKPSSSASIGKEGREMSDERIPEAVGNDLDGLNDTIKSDADKLAAAEALAKTAAEAPAEGTQTAAEDEEAAVKKAAEAAEAAAADVGAGAGVGDPVVEDTSDTGEIIAALGLKEVPEGFALKELSIKQFVEGKLVDVAANFMVDNDTGEQVFLGYVKEEVKPAAPAEEEKEPEVEAAAAAAAAAAASSAMESGDPLLAGLNLIGKGMNLQNESLKEINETLKKQSKTLEEVVKTNETKIEKVKEVTIVEHPNLDQSLMSINGHDPFTGVEKTEEKPDVFVGLCPELDELQKTILKRNSQ